MTENHYKKKVDISNTVSQIDKLKIYLP